MVRERDRKREKEKRPQPPFGPSVASLCHPWFTTTNLSYRFPIFETSATALCGTTGKGIVIVTILCPGISYIYIYIIYNIPNFHLSIYIYIYTYTSQLTAGCAIHDKSSTARGGHGELTWRTGTRGQQGRIRGQREQGVLEAVQPFFGFWPHRKMAIWIGTWVKMVG